MFRLPHELHDVRRHPVEDHRCQTRLDQLPGTIPEELSLYQPYQNRECLYCHGEARFFNEGLHGEMRAELDSNDVSCLECHTSVHDVAHLDTLEMWEGGQ